MLNEQIVLTRRMAMVDGTIEGFQERTSRDTDKWPLTEEQSRVMSDLILEENSALKRLGQHQLAMRRMRKQLEEAEDKASKAMEDREVYCRQIEKELAIPEGTGWTVNFDNKCVERC